MALEISSRKGEFLEESHCWKIWRGGRGLDHLRGKGFLWDGPLERH